MIDKIGEYIEESIASNKWLKEKSIPNILKVAESISQCLLNDGKIICCGNGTAVSLAQYFASLMINRVKYDRPALPAVSICSGVTEISSIYSTDYKSIFSRQVQSIGQPHDILLIFSLDGNGVELIEAVQAAHERNINVILLTGNSQSEIMAHLLSEEIALVFTSDNQNIIYEMQVITANCILRLVDNFLFNF